MDNPEIISGVWFLFLCGSIRVGQCCKTFNAKSFALFFIFSCLVEERSNEATILSCGVIDNMDDDTCFGAIESVDDVRFELFVGCC